MPIVVNSDASAISALYNLSRSNDALRASLEKLSSGKKINRSSDDAGGMAVSYKSESDNRAERIMYDPAIKYSAVTEKIADARAENGAEQDRFFMQPIIWSENTGTLGQLMYELSIPTTPMKNHAVNP